MPGELLDDEDVRPLRQEVRYTASPQIVRSKRFDTGFVAAFLQDVPDPLAAQTTRADAAGLIHMAKERARMRAAELQPVSCCRPCPVRHIYESIFAALPPMTVSSFTSGL